MTKTGEYDSTEPYEEVDEKVYKLWAKKYPKPVKQKETVLNQKDINKFYRIWKKEFISQRGRYKNKNFDTKKEAEYKNCLFTIYKYHWDDVDGFQINMVNVGKTIGKSNITVHRMISFFLKTGIIKRCHNYMPGKQTYFYHKNSPLFNYLYRSMSNDYYVWLSNNINNKSNTNNINTNINYISNVFTNRKGKTVNGQKKRGRKPRKYTENYELLTKIEKEFIPIISKLNRKQHQDLQIDFNLHFKFNGDFSGRSWSFFCKTLNEEKKHNSDNSMEKRTDFLKRVGLGNYKQIYDIKSEVPRTTILSNTGIWKPDSYDIYTEIIKESGVQEITRNRIKDLYMRFNFGTGTQKERYNYFRNSRIQKIKNEYGMNEREAKDYFYLGLENNCEYNFDEWVLLSEAIEKIQGKSWGNLIFWWTSLIQIKTIYETLKDTGIRIYNVYDGFYCPSGITKKYLVKTVEQSADYIYNKYIKKTPYPY